MSSKELTGWMAFDKLQAERRKQHAPKSRQHGAPLPDVMQSNDPKALIQKMWGSGRRKLSG